MRGSDRRACLRLLGAVTLVPSIAWPNHVLAAPPSRLVLPTGAQLLTRRVERELHDGKVLTVVRGWRCHFTETGWGAIVEGAQISSRVDAPPQLATLARMEEQREESGPFPAMLDSRGQISSLGSSVSTNLTQAIDEAMAILVAQGRSSAELAEGRRFLSRIGDAAGSAIAQVPEDLFYPARLRSGFSRTLDLPGGVQGTVEVAVETRIDAVSGLLQSSERSVITRVGDEARHNREVWTLAPA